MKKELIDSVKWADEIINNSDDVDLDNACANLSRWIGYFQHERLVHLIVTALFALLTLISFAILVTNITLFTGILAFAFLIMTCFYVGHYYRLENTTQLLYHKMDMFIKIKKEK